MSYQEFVDRKIAGCPEAKNFTLGLAYGEVCPCCKQPVPPIEAREWTIEKILAREG